MSVYIYIYMQMYVLLVVKKVPVPRSLICPYPTWKSNRRRLSSSPYSSFRST